MELAKELREWRKLNAFARTGYTSRNARALDLGFSPLLLVRGRVRRSVDPPVGGALRRLARRMGVLLRVGLARARDDLRLRLRGRGRLPLHRGAPLDRPADAGGRRARGDRRGVARGAAPGVH